MKTCYALSPYLINRRLFLKVLLLLAVCDTQAQTKYWDMALTEILVEQNKRNFKDNTQALDNQLVSHLTVLEWKRTQDNFKKIVDKIDKHLTQAFIIAADITTLYNIYKSMDEMVDYQNKSFQLLYKFPWAAGWFYQKQRDVYQSASDMVRFILLIVMSYGDLNKMQVSSRETIFRELNTLVAVLRAKCYSLYQKMKQVELAQLYKNSKPYEFFNKDKEKVEEILKNIKSF